jgi:glucose-1-phosphate thymidylyltransferase
MHQCENTGILLCGGMGTRLFPITKAINKHLLAVASKPMVYYSISVLLLMKIQRIILVCDPAYLNLFEQQLLPLRKLGLNLIFVEQKSPDGIVHAIEQAMPFVIHDNVTIVLGDNIFIGANLSAFLRESIQGEQSCVTFTTKVKDPSRFGVVERSTSGVVSNLLEKPQYAHSSEVLTGFYHFESEFLYNNLQRVDYSVRKEKEIMNLLQFAHKKNKLKVVKLPRGVVWYDAGTFADLDNASNFILSAEARTGEFICVPEEIMLRNEMVGVSNFLEVIDNYPEGMYKSYLHKLCNY